MKKMRQEEEQKLLQQLCILTIATLQEKSEGAFVAYVTQ
jgi:hypothetical protein